MKQRYTALLVVLFTLLLSPTSPLFGQTIPCLGTLPASTLVSGLTWNPATVPVVAPPYAVNTPPIAAGAGVPPYACTVCPALFSTPICAGQYARIWMCTNNVYTISMCSSATLWNSTLSITTSGWANVTTGIFTSDNDGCGTVNGHATLTFAPTVSALYYIRVFSQVAANQCTVNGALCGTLQISCAPAPPPPFNDNPCGADPIPVGAVCNFNPASTSWATQTNPPAVPACGTFVGSDVWYSAVVPASGALAIQTNHVSATNLAMAVYSAPSCAGPFTSQGCNADIAPGVLTPFISFNLPALAGQTVYIRVWPQGGSAFGGTFEICAFEPVPPPNDNPCSATIVPVTAGCTAVSSTNESATATVGIPVPSCVAAGPYNDVWFTVTVPAVPVGAGVIINTTSAILNDAALAIYTTSVDCNGVFTQVPGACSDPAGATMPALQVNQNGTTIVAGTVLYVRVWNKTSVFGNFTICATPTTPPLNNEPCGAIAVPVNYGCMFSSFTNVNASNTPLALAGQHANVPTTPSCDSPTDNDVWFTVQVPSPLPVPSLILDMDDGTMTDAAMAVYRVTSGSCAGGNLVLTQIGCAIGGSTNGVNMPMLTLASAGLVANEILYVRIWRQNGVDGTFQLCARRPDAAPGNCNFTLQMFDAGGDGWNGSYVTVNVGGVPTNYTIGSANGNITFGANIGQVVTLSYTAVGGFQNQISYQLTTPGGGLLFGSGTTPATGLVFGFVVDGACNVPPAPQEDCAGAVQVCQIATAMTANPQTPGGAVQDIFPANRGCLITNEHMGVWFKVQVTASGQLGFTANPFPYGNSDYDFGVWGPYPSVVCPPVGLPARCSWADGPSMTGLNYTATDVSEGVFGDSWNRYLDVLAGEWYIIFIDNWYYTGLAFDLTFQLQGGASIDCLLPVELLSFNGKPLGTAVELKWSTGSEQASDHFIVERSLDGSLFVPIGRVEAAGNSSTLLEYDHVDKDPAQGINYYRLRQVDTDGTTKTSQVISVVFKGGGASIQVMPNPATESLQAIFDLPVGEPFQWRITDASGRAIAKGTSTSVDGPDRLEIGLGKIESGAYALSLHGRSEDLIGQVRFVKQ
ncbi:MAG: hypothetical protein ABI432_15510 [Flavobacteriales bacterium]